MNQKARQAVLRARTQLVVREPFFGHLALMLNMVETDRVPTCGVDGVNLYYNPEFVLKKCDEEQLVGVMAHEVMHCVYSHFSRRGHRDHTKFNMAGDFRINDDLKKVPFQLPYKPATLAECMKAKPGEHFHLYDPQFKDMSTEEIYEKIPDPPKQEGGGGYVVVDIGGCGAVMDAGAGPGDPDDEGEGNGQGGAKLSPEQVAHGWQANVRMAVSVARANNAGQTPGYLERLVTQLKRPKVSWRDLTAQFIDQSMTTDYSFRRPNRRYIHAGLILPGNVADALHEMVMFVDCSGSIGEEMITAFVSEVAGALDSGTCDHLYVVYADTHVRVVDEYVPGDIVKAKCPDGGGTDFDNSFEWLAKNVPDAACVIYLTDMETGSFGKEPECPVLWGAYNTEARLPSFKPPFGTVVHVDSPNY
jgi:predicted metal-dependent peptidase